MQPDRPVYIYIISESSNGPVKIGYAQDCEKRLSAIRVGHPDPYGYLWVCFKIEFPNVEAARFAEWALHDQFEPRNIHGEWFNLTEEEAIAGTITTLRAHEVLVLHGTN